MSSRRGGHDGGPSRSRGAIAAMGALALAAGCSSPPRFLAEEFDGPPRSLSDFQGEDRWTPSRIPSSRDRSELSPQDAGVLNGRLIAGGNRLLRAEFPFQDFRGSCDFMAAGGILDGSAGIFVEERRRGEEEASRPSHFTLALNGRGEWRAYRGLPGRPLGVVAWKPLPDSNPAAFRVLGAEAVSGTVRFLVDGKVVASFPGREVPEKGRSSPSAGPALERRVGIFAENLVASFDNLVFWEPSPEDASTGRGAPAAPHRPEAIGGRLVEEAAGRAEVFRRKPTRAGLLEVIEARTAAERAFRAEDAAAADSAAAETVKLLLSLEQAATKARSEDLLRMAARARRLPSQEALLGRQGETFARRAREAGSSGRPAEALIFWLAAGEIERTAEVDRGVRDLFPTIEPPLAFAYVARQESATSGEFPRQTFYSAARSIYGALPERKEGEVRVEVTVKEARVTGEAEDSVRKVARAVSGSPMPFAARSELTRLEKGFPEDLREAEARAKVAHIVDLDGKARFAALEIGSRSVEVLEEDARVLRRSAVRLDDLRRRRDAEKAVEREFVSVPARLHTDAARVRLTYRLAAPDGIEVAGAIEVYEAIEQWTHPADPAGAIEASAWSEKERDRMVDSVRSRALVRLRNGLALERLLSKLGKDEATRFIVRFARSSGEEEDRARVEWRLKSVYGLDGSTLDRVLARLLEPSRGVS